ncbi:MAG: GNAT family N-acetyltransferase [Anaerolineae bacterium]|nr:GNAT family N-acetyltransferase [Anaerolineae bacterium]
MLTATLLRPAARQDAAAIQAVFYPHEEQGAFQAQLQTWWERQEQGRLFYLLAEQSGELAGQGQLHRWPDGRGEIANVQVAAAWQNQGLGTVILNRLIQQASQWHCPTIEIAVADSNPRAQALYQRLGFHTAHPLRSPHDEPGVIMIMEFGVF